MHRHWLRLWLQKLFAALFCIIIIFIVFLLIFFCLFFFNDIVIQSECCSAPMSSEYRCLSLSCCCSRYLYVWQYFFLFRVAKIDCLLGAICSVGWLAVAQLLSPLRTECRGNEQPSVGHREYGAVCGHRYRYLRPTVFCTAPTTTWHSCDDEMPDETGCPHRIPNGYFSFIRFFGQWKLHATRDVSSVANIRRATLRWFYGSRTTDVIQKFDFYFWAIILRCGPHRDGFLYCFFLLFVPVEISLLLVFPVHLSGAWVTRNVF